MGDVLSEELIVAKKLVRISENDYNVIINMVYAQEDNFVGKQIYKFSECYLHENVAIKLKSASNMANELGYNLKIYDAFRPIEAQKRLWEVCSDSRFVGDPYAEKLYVPHCRGIAVDLTLVSKNTDMELNMGTAVDCLEEKSFPSDTTISAEAISNRMLLCGIMTVAGFKYLATEWWHFDVKNYLDYPIIENGTDFIQII